MQIGITCKTNIPDLKIDYIEVKNSDGNTFNLSRNSTEFGWNDETKEYNALWSGVSVNDNTDFREMEKLPKYGTISSVGVYYEEGPIDAYIRDFDVEMVAWEPIPANKRHYHVDDVMTVADRI